MKVINFLIAFSLCFMIPISFLSSTIQQYVLFIPLISLLFIELFIIKRRKIFFSLLFLIFMFLFTYIITGFEFGLGIDGFIPLLGIILIPVTIQIFIYINPQNIYKYFIIMFSIYEIVISLVIIQQGIYFDVSKNNIIRDNLSWAFPNYFAMLSVIKITLGYMIYKNNYMSKKRLLLFTLVSLLSIVLSLSRTAYIMLIVVLLINLIFIENKNKIVVINKVLISMILIFLLYLINTLNSLKNEFAGATLDNTLMQRFETWRELLELVKEYPIFGIGFRSTSDFIIEGVNTAHNDYIDILIKGGLILFFVVYFYFLKRALVLFKNKKYLEFSILLAILIAGFTQNPIKFLPLMFFFSVILSESYKINELSQEK